MAKCKKCTMPIDKDCECSCEPGICCKCCTCDKGCQCGCQKKDKK